MCNCADAISINREREASASLSRDAIRAIAASDDKCAAIIPRPIIGRPWMSSDRRFARNSSLPKIIMIISSGDGLGLPGDRHRPARFRGLLFSMKRDARRGHINQSNETTEHWFITPRKRFALIATPTRMTFEPFERSGTEIEWWKSAETYRKLREKRFSAIGRSVGGNASAHMCPLEEERGRKRA